MYSCCRQLLGVVCKLMGINNTCMLILPSYMQIYVIKTHGSESRGQEEAGLHDERVSYLQVAPL